MYEGLSGDCHNGGRYSSADVVAMSSAEMDSYDHQYRGGHFVSPVEMAIGVMATNIEHLLGNLFRRVVFIVVFQ